MLSITTIPRSSVGDRLIVASASLPCLIAVMAFGWSGIAPAMGEEAAAAKPAATSSPDLDRTGAAIEALKRLKGVDLESSPQIKAAVMKVLESARGKPQFVEIVQLFDLKGQNPGLAEIALKESATSAGVDAARLILATGDSSLLKAALDAPSPAEALRAAEVLGNVGNKAALDLLLPLLTDRLRPIELRKEAAKALARAQGGANALLHLARENQLPEELKLTVGAALHIAPWPAIKGEAAKVIPLPQTRTNETLPPTAELIKLKGDPDRGARIFASEQTGCSTCHRVNGLGTNFAPDLSEIGAKLGKEALVEAILAPSAGISVGYEGFQIELKNGDLATGILVSETADAISIKAVSGVVTAYKKDEIAVRDKMTVSLMPTGLESAMTTQDFVDLIEYLAALKKAAATAPGAAR